MSEASALAFAVLAPFLLLGLVLWMARLEDSLSDGTDPVQPAGDPAPGTEPTGAVAA